MKRETRIVFTVLRATLGIGLLVYLNVSGVISWTALLGLASAWPITLAAFLILLVSAGVTA